MNDELIRDIYERLGSMEAKIDDVRTIRDTAHAADKKADQALQKSDENSRAIDRLSSTIKWSVGLIASILLPVALFVLGKIFS